MGGKGSEKWGKIRSNDDPKNGVKNGVLFHEKSALENDDIFAGKIRVEILDKIIL